MPGQVNEIEEKELDFEGEIHAVEHAMIAMEIIRLQNIYRRTRGKCNAEFSSNRLA